MNPKRLQDMLENAGCTGFTVSDAYDSVDRVVEFTIKAESTDVDIRAMRKYIDSLGFEYVSHFKNGTMIYLD